MRILIILLSLASTLPLLAIECGDFAFNVFESGYPVYTPKWTPDGSQILFPHSSRIYLIDTGGMKIQSTSEPRSGDANSADYSPDLSPDGSRVVFATSKHKPGFFSQKSRNLDIGTSNLDGSDYRRLTDTEEDEVNPIWSPDGSRIAFIKSRPWTLYTMASDGSNQRDITPQGLEVKNDPPVWSPDGSRLAFLANEGPQVFAMYTIATDGSDPRRVSRANGRPAWSPDSTRIAYVVVDEKDAAGGTLYTARWDGSDVQEVAGSQESAPGPGYFGVSNISWSPDGSEVRFTAYGENLRGSDWPPVSGIYAVRTDGSDYQLVARIEAIQGLPLIAWSPDNSRIAARVVGNAGRISSGHIYTVASNGSDLQVLARMASGRLVAENSGWLDTPDPSICSEGLVVPDPKKNSGLVQDCETLTGLQSTLAGANRFLGWTPDTPMEDWAGVYLGGDPSRVSQLTLEDAKGIIPPKLGNLTGLKRLDLRSNGLQGSIPPELGNLINLVELRLSENQLTGSIPLELGNLSSLEELSLSSNELTGSIPPELANIPNRPSINVSRNRLAGCIPRGVYIRQHQHDGLEPC